MDLRARGSDGRPPNGHLRLFRGLRKQNERRARVRAVLEARREQRLKIDRVIQVQRQRRLRQGG